MRQSVAGTLWHAPASKKWRIRCPKIRKKQKKKAE